MLTKHQKHILKLMKSGWQMLELPNRRILRLFVGFDKNGESLFRVKGVRNETFTALLECGAVDYEKANDKGNPYIYAT